MINFRLECPKEFESLARLGVPPVEWDVKLSDGTFAGVLEIVDDGFMYTDSFRHLTVFFDGESFSEVVEWIALSMNDVTYH